MPEETAEQKQQREAAEAEAAKGKGKGGDEEGGKKVELDPDQYDALLDRLQELEDQVAKGGRRNVSTVDELAEELEAPRRQPAPRRGVDPSKINDMSNLELARLIMAEVQQNVGQPLLVRLEEIRVKDEIRELRQELKEAGLKDDFNDLKDAIYVVASKNPNLSIKEAYKLAKKDQPAKGKENGEDEEDDPSSRRGKLLHLPPRIPRGERPTHSRAATDRGAPETRMDAADRALEDMEKDGKLKL